MPDPSLTLSKEEVSPLPAQFVWFQRLPKSLTSWAWMVSHLDREAVRKLFGVGERCGRQLMAGLPGICAGTAGAISLTHGGSQIEFRGTEDLVAKLLELS